MNKRKFQVCNGYLLEFDQLARLLNVLVEQSAAKKLDRGFLTEATGLTDRHVETLVSMGSAMGLIRPGVQILSPAGAVLAKHDIFLESKAGLEWCHYFAASRPRNLVWYEVFNTLLPRERAMTVAEWTQVLRNQLSGQYSEATLKKNLREEVRFVTDAYLHRNFSRLELLQQTSDGRLYRRRYPKPAPAIFAATLYDFAAVQSLSLVQVEPLPSTPGSPAMLFAMDDETVRQNLEDLHLRGWIRYESTHNLNQVRLKEGFTAVEFLTAHFEERDPSGKPEPIKENPELPLT